mmetsp:Transcript_41406/g.127970  ORF Transcript_41406/g.127970 Transcript_41406/m.127970 type:complete len:238 (-) Transcript_41406:2498-3211(-)
MPRRHVRRIAKRAIPEPTATTHPQIPQIHHLPATLSSGGDGVGNGGNVNGCTVGDGGSVFALVAGNRGLSVAFRKCAGGGTGAVTSALVYSPAQFVPKVISCEVPSSPRVKVAPKFMKAGAASMYRSALLSVAYAVRMGTMPQNTRFCFVQTRPIVDACGRRVSPRVLAAMPKLLHSEWPVSRSMPAPKPSTSSKTVRTCCSSSRYAVGYVFTVCTDHGILIAAIGATKSLKFMRTA